MLHNGAPIPFAAYPQMARDGKQIGEGYTAVIPVVRRTVSLKLAWAIQGDSYNEK